jgi:predicted O-methyltransferase YrrM
MLTERALRLHIDGLQLGETPAMTAIREYIDRQGLEHEEIFPSQMLFLKVLCRAVGARRILELGTCLGYSTAAFVDIVSTAGLDDWQIVTVERDPSRSREARQLLADGGLGRNVCFLVGNAEDHCADLLAAGEVFDVVFLDVAEVIYPSLYPACVDLLSDRGLLVVDNVLMSTVDGWFSGQNVVEGYGPTIDALQQLLALATTDPRVDASIVPFGSGLLLCHRK